MNDFLLEVAPAKTPPRKEFALGLMDKGVVLACSEGVSDDMCHQAGHGCVNPGKSRVGDVRDGTQSR